MSDTSLDELKTLILNLNEKIDNLNKRVENIEKSSENMDKHISFVDSVYETAWMPLNFITSNISALITDNKDIRELPAPDKQIRLSLKYNKVRDIDHDKSFDDELDDTDADTE